VLAIARHRAPSQLQRQDESNEQNEQATH
jgi:hypothetical protein